MKQTKKIVINFTTGKIKTYGDIKKEHIDIARAGLLNGKIEPSVGTRMMRWVKKFIKCAKFAFKKEEPERHITVCRPLLLNCVKAEKAAKG